MQPPERYSFATRALQRDAQRFSCATAALREKRRKSTHTDQCTVGAGRFAARKRPRLTAPAGELPESRGQSEDEDGNSAARPLRWPLSGLGPFPLPRGSAEKQHPSARSESLRLTPRLCAPASSPLREAGRSSGGRFSAAEKNLQFAFLVRAGAAHACFTAEAIPPLPIVRQSRSPPSCSLS